MIQAKRAFFLVYMFSAAMVLRAQTLVTSSGLTPTQYVQNVLLGAGVTASNITYTGYPNAIGKFSVTGLPNDLNLDSGLVLTTGTVLNNDINGPGPHGPNNLGSSGFDNLFAGDPDLAILGANPSFNAAVLEFDFVPTSDTIKFDFVFGSDEYMEFVDGGVSDAFGFFLSGPGIVGPFSNNAINIALVPGTNTPITIDSLNAGDNGTYYVNNETPPGNLLQYDGFTTVLTAIGAVQCNQMYHIKIAISDIADGVWDSGVFLKAGSFSSSGLQISGGTLVNDSLTTDSIFTEGCQQAVYIFSRPDSNGVDTIFFFTGGTATEGVDYTDVPPFIIIDQGEFSDTIVISAFDDILNESLETVTIFITYNNPCGVDTVEKTLYLKDYQKMVALMDGDTVICPGLGSFPVLEPLVTGGFGGYHYLWYPTQDTTDTLVAALGQTTVFYVNIEDDCGKTITSNPVTIVKQCPVIIPNVITANHDGNNDVFIIQNISDYPENEVWFYNRWGTLLYYVKHYQNDWEPKVTDGVYYYVVDTKVDEPFRGFFTVFANP
jgi:gliding motility-associated-like protein